MIYIIELAMNVNRLGRMWKRSWPILRY